MSFTRCDVGGVVFHTADAITAAGGVVHGFATRLGGVSRGDCAQLNLGMTRHDDPAAVRENYRRFCAAVGADEASLVMTHQVHEDGVRVATRADVLPDLLDPIPYRTDALVTNEPGLALVIYYADCIPVLLYDPVHRAIGAVHSGWRGTAAQIAPKALAEMQARYGTDPTEVLAAIGPGICPTCFETDDDVPDAMSDRLGPVARSFVRSGAGGKSHVDLKGLIAWELRQAGVERIETLPLCTGCRPDLYWSHRKLGDRRGNQAAIIQLL